MKLFLILIIGFTAILPFQAFSQENRGYVPEKSGGGRGYDRKSGSVKITQPVKKDSLITETIEKKDNVNPTDTLTQEQRLVILESEFLKLNDFNRERKSSLMQSGILLQNAKKDRITGLIVQFGGMLVGGLLIDNQKTRDAGLVLLGGTSVIGMYYHLSAWRKIEKAGKRLW